MIKKLFQNKEQLFTILLSLIIIAHYWWPLLCNILIMLTLLLVILDSDTRQDLFQTFKNKWFWGLSIPFWLTLIGLSNTENLDLGLFMVEKRLSLAVFPLLFLSIKSRFKTSNLIDVVVLGGVSSVLGCIIQSVYLYSTGVGGTELFYSDLLAYPLYGQAVYLAFMINTWLLLIGVQVYRKEGVLGKNKLLLFSIIPFLLVVHFLLASRMSMLVLLMVAGVAFVGWGIKKLGLVKSSVIVVASIIGIGLLTIVFPKSLNRFRDIDKFSYDYENKSPLNHFNAEHDAKNWTGITARLAIWNSIVEDLDELPINGYGSGDVEGQLLKQYEKRNFYLALENNFNTHNQYFDYLLSTGFIGVGILILSLLALFIYYLRVQNYPAAIFIVILALTMMTENIFNRNMGIVFAGYIGSLLFSNGRLHEKV